MDRIQRLVRRAREQDGQTMAEYAVVLAVIVTAVVGVLAGFGHIVGQNIQTISNRFPSS